MRNIKDEMSNLERIVKMLATQFGSNTEVILHDLSKDYDKTIVAVENNHVTGRSVGDGGTNLGLEVLRRHTNETTGDIYNYFTKTKDGKLLRSSTMYFRDESGEPIGSLCINTDITDYINLQDTIQELTIYTPDRQINEVFASSVTDLTEHFIDEAKTIVNKSASEMTRGDKMEVLEFLDRKGFFLISKSGDIACDFLDISKYTLYKYLNEIRETVEEKNA